MVVRILTGDVRERLAELPDESVHCVVTSPPYYSLRDYNMPGQIGLEPTLAEYIDTMTAVFRDVRRVLRSDGVCWLNIGDSYAGAGAGGGGNRKGNEHGQHDAMVGSTRGVVPEGMKPKDLMMVPARLALALQADGWWLRSDIIWHKKAPMPESVTDRPTSAHEHIFLLTKSPRYFWDQEAVAEPVAAGSLRARTKAPSPGRYDYFPGNGGTKGLDDLAQRMRSGEHSRRNIRNVWTLGSENFPGAHFATFPSEIPRRCIKAGTSEHGCCSACGAPWSRVVEKSYPNAVYREEVNCKPRNLGQQQDRPGRMYEAGHGAQKAKPRHETTGWQPGCTCDADVIPCTVMDIFFGSGTTGLVADQLGRDCIGIELNAEYAAMAEKRIRGASPMFAQVTA